MRPWVVLVCAMAGPAAADTAFDATPLEACLREAPGRTEKLGCIGQAAEACWQADGNTAPTNAGPCMGKEYAWWQERVDINLAVLRLHGGLAEAERRTLGWPTDVLDSLAAAQATWLAYREEACGYVAALWGPGSGQAVAWMECMMRRTAEHAFWLDERLDDE